MKVIKNAKEFKETITKKAKEVHPDSVIYESTPSQYPCMVWFDRDMDTVFARIEYELDQRLCLNVCKDKFELFAGEGTFEEVHELPFDRSLFLVTGYFPNDATFKESPIFALQSFSVLRIRRRKS